MNLYCQLINQAIHYIEEHIHAPLTLEDMSKMLCVSPFHFNRMFKTVVGKTLKQYILGRKLTLAYDHLVAHNDSVIDVAYDFGFQYPEVFSRAFKKHFGIPPSRSRQSKINTHLVEKATVVDRHIINYKGDLTLKGSCEYIEGIHLEGIALDVDINDVQCEQHMRSTGAAFLEESKVAASLNHDTFYTVVHCHGKDNGMYTVFYGKEKKGHGDSLGYQPRLVPEGWYARFHYDGDMFQIRETFLDDLYKWIMIQEIELHANGVGMVNIYGRDYTHTGKVHMLVPIKKP
ncbi:helix-turn-helix transcriptional regulator [Vallitalea pronyensis]|uniref:Helix-turn-helix transcriptional regulator n=1 Tax=Vallitalea pronyensis TaxID=1348613 RepID=A0A8J8MGP2_9FIRM|nr:AraC family transcriptional regulator [Vallitalea pronyensis]QUI21320.1 helix-turn-helix transcriptional regulator [Vallitalea pronyensis]